MEDLPVSRVLSGYPPYGPLPSWVVEMEKGFPSFMEPSSHLVANLGYKIVMVGSL
jgi:hypothetical protein